MGRRVARLGWVCDLPDPRDHEYAMDSQLASDFWTIRSISR
jgi:hypothetical protein